MSKKKAVPHTESEEKFTFQIQQTIKFRIEEFETLMNFTTPEEGGFLSKDVSSELVPSLSLAS